MDNVKYNLFCNAVLETSLEMIENDLKNCKEYASVSIKRTKQLNKAFDIKAHFRPSPKQIVAILIAAAILLLTSCGIIYRDTIREFIINFYNNNINVSFSKESEKNKEFNVFEASYIPDGYELIEKIQTTTFVYKKWESFDEKYFSIRQNPVENVVFDLDNNFIETNQLIIKDKKILFYKYKTTFCYIWNDRKYAFALDADIGFSNEEAERIISEIIVE